jgi:hypothetical protein
MGLNFRKRLKVHPGVALNVSKTGLSLSLSIPGLSGVTYSLPLFKFASLLRKNEETKQSDEGK